MQQKLAKYFILISTIGSIGFYFLMASKYIVNIPDVDDYGFF
jgi:hypothetical protein